jgi:hypothetical protein
VAKSFFLLIFSGILSQWWKADYHSRVPMKKMRPHQIWVEFSLDWEPGAPQALVSLGTTPYIA